MKQNPSRSQTKEKHLKMDFSDPDATDFTSDSWKNFSEFAFVEKGKIPGCSAVPTSMSILSSLFSDIQIAMCALPRHKCDYRMPTEFRSVQRFSKICDYKICDSKNCHLCPERNIPHFR
jgi:hypothetical protein